MMPKSSEIEGRSCAICDGSGQLVLMNSWFTSEGYRRERCGFCHGTGQSNYRNGDWETAQRRLRALSARPRP
jgi:hypothetical protein